MAFGSTAIARKAQKAAPRPTPTRGILGTGKTFEDGSRRPAERAIPKGAVQDFRDRRKARKRIAAIQRRLPGYLQEENPKVKLRGEMYSRGSSGELWSKKGRDTLRLAPSTVATLAGLNLPDDDLDRDSPAVRQKIAITKAAGLPVPKATSDPSTRANKRSSKTVIHELIHAHQPEGKNRPSVDLPEWLTEGGAELLSRKLSRQLFGSKYPDKRHPYQPYVNRVKKVAAKKGLRPAKYVRGTLD